MPLALPAIKIIDGVAYLSGKGLEGKDTDGLLADGVTIGSAVLKFGCGNSAPSAGGVLHHHVDAEVIAFGSYLGNGAAEAVRAAACIPGADNGDGTLGVRGGRGWGSAGVCRAGIDRLAGIILVTTGRQSQNHNQGKGQCEDLFLVHHFSSLFLALLAFYLFGTDAINTVLGDNLSRKNGLGAGKQIIRLMLA